jgi:cyanophycinase-like exopeptidase
VALVGSGEYLDVMVDVDRALLLGRPPRAVFLPTAAAEEGEERVRYRLELGGRHFARLGVEAVPLPVLTREDAAREDLAALVAGAGLVYLSGGNPGYLAAALRDTPVWKAIVATWQAGAALAGCSAGACALTYAAEDVRAGRALRAAGTAAAAGVAGAAGPAGAAGAVGAATAAAPAGPAATASTAPAEGPDPSGADGSARPYQQPSGLAVIPEVAVIPHYDRMLQWVPDFAERYLARVPPEVTVVGVDEDTAIVTAGDAPLGVRSFTVAGRQSAWVVDGAGHRTEYPAGASFSVPGAAAR